MVVVLDELLLVVDGGLLEFELVLVFVFVLGVVVLVFVLVRLAGCAGVVPLGVVECVVPPAVGVAGVVAFTGKLVSGVKAGGSGFV